MYRFFFFLHFVLLALWQPAQSVDCSTAKEQSLCGMISGCIWFTSTGTCNCDNGVDLDLLFVIDASGSIGAGNYATQLEFVKAVIEQGIAITYTHVGFIRFSTEVEVLLNFEASTGASVPILKEFVDNTVSEYPGASTYTEDALEAALAMFANYSSPDRSKLIVLLTDGNPTIGQDVCDLELEIKSAGISVVIVGVGGGWDQAQIDCIVEDPDENVISVSSFSQSAFDAVLPTVTDITCPVTYSLTISEVAPETGGGAGQWRGVELYNTGGAVALSLLALSGMFEGNLTDSDVELQQGQYLVVYDNNVTAPDAPNCDDCACNKTAAGLCRDAVYMGCGGDGDTCKVAETVMNSTSWSIMLTDTTDDSEVDSLTYDSAGGWPTVIAGYTFELANVGFDNQQGYNWVMSCNAYGSPGQGLVTNCSATCDPDRCTVTDTGANCPTNGGACNCSSSFYEYLGQCLVVPPPGNCIALYGQSGEFGSQGFVYTTDFVWEAAAGASTVSKTYAVRYTVDDTAKTVTTTRTTSNVRTKQVIDQFRDGDVAGVVWTEIGMGRSESVDCLVQTLAPTDQTPTMSPTTPAPTPSPTSDNPRLWLGGDICLKDRCACNRQDWDCYDRNETIYKEFSESNDFQYVTVDKWPADFDDTEVVVRWDIKFVGAYNKTADAATTATPLDDGSGQSSRRMLMARAGAASARQLLQETTVAPLTDINRWFSDNSTIRTTSDSVRLQLVMFEEDVNDADESNYEEFVLTLRECWTKEGNYTCTIVYPDTLHIIIVDSVFEASQNNPLAGEAELPDWVIPLIIALAVVLIIVAFLVYRFWWQKRETSAELQDTKADADAAIQELEQGFGADLDKQDVAFNPLATGVPGTGAATVNPNAEIASRQQDASGQRADVAVERFQHRQEMGQHIGGARASGRPGGLPQPGGY